MIVDQPSRITLSNFEVGWCGSQQNLNLITEPGQVETRLGIGGGINVSGSLTLSGDIEIEVGSSTLPVLKLGTLNVGNQSRLFINAIEARARRRNNSHADRSQPDQWEYLPNPLPDRGFTHGPWCFRQLVPRHGDSLAYAAGKIDAALYQAMLAMRTVTGSSTHPTWSRSLWRASTRRAKPPTGPKAIGTTTGCLVPPIWSRRSSPATTKSLTAAVPRMRRLRICSRICAAAGCWIDD